MSTAEFFQFFFYLSNWDIPMNLLFIGIAILYLLLTGAGHLFFSFASPVRGQQKLFFILALIVYYFAMGSPLNLLAHELFSMHMLQMSLLYIVLPPLLLLGIPDWFVRPILHFQWVRKLGSVFTRPLFILFLFNGLISMYHLPVIFDAIMANHLYHYVSHTILLFFALCMWWPVICPVPEVDRVKPLHKLAFIFSNGILLTPVCALVIFADQPMFTPFLEMSNVVPIMSPLDDQQLGGVIMKIMQEVVYITAIGLIFIRWIREQRQKDEEEMKQWTAQEKEETQRNEKQMGNYSWN